MTKSETFSLGAYVQFLFPFGLITSTNSLLLVSLRLPSPFAMLKGTADSSNFKTLSKSITLPDFVEYDNDATICPRTDKSLTTYISKNIHNYFFHSRFLT